ncbi:transcription elongation factor, mitochondrial isoform X3 [Lycorma delicatula]|uniref:transcription elongation factor, mitochondrial isoform X3 n=1 Tax=Lycorma delicatula TaxID=130591 RepID=UPI003F513728
MFIKLVRFSSRIISLFPKNTPAFYFSSSARDKTNNLVLGQYSEEQQEHVLNVLNTFSNSTPQIKIGAKQLKSIQSFLKDNKEFQNLNQVLDLNGIGPYTLKNLCNGILIQDKGSNGNKKAAPKVKSGILIPPLHEAQKQQIKSITGIQIGYFYISWARFDLATNTVTDWMQTNFNNVTDLKSLHNLYEFVLSFLCLGAFYEWVKTLCEEIKLDWGSFPDTAVSPQGYCNTRDRTLNAHQPFLSWLF